MHVTRCARPSWGVGRSGGARSVIKRRGWRAGVHEREWSHRPTWRWRGIVRPQQLNRWDETRSRGGEGSSVEARGGRLGAEGGLHQRLWCLTASMGIQSRRSVRCTGKVAQSGRRRRNGRPEKIEEGWGSRVRQRQGVGGAASVSGDRVYFCISVFLF